MAEQDEQWEPASEENPEQEVINRQLLELMRYEIIHLPEPYLSVCMLRIYAELPYSEIATEYLAIKEHYFNLLEDENVSAEVKEGIAKIRRNGFEWYDQACYDTFIEVLYNAHPKQTGNATII